MFAVAAAEARAMIDTVTADNSPAAQELNDRDNNGITKLCCVFCKKVPPVLVRCQDLFDGDFIFLCHYFTLNKRAS